MAVKVGGNFIPRSVEGSGQPLAKVHCFDCGQIGYLSKNCGRHVNVACQQDSSRNDSTCDWGKLL